MEDKECLCKFLSLALIEYRDRNYHMSDGLNSIMQMRFIADV